MRRIRYKLIVWEIQIQVVAAFSLSAELLECWPHSIDSAVAHKLPDGHTSLILKPKKLPMVRSSLSARLLGA